MKKIKMIAGLLILCLLFSACSARKAPKQLESSDFLYASDMAIYDKTGQPITLASKRVCVSAATAADMQPVHEALKEQTYNSIELQLAEDLVDSSGDAWVISAAAKQMLQATMESCDKQGKYLLISFSEYPKTYTAWYEGSDFNENVISIWQQLAEIFAKEAYFGAYILNNLPRPGSSEDVTALTYYEQLLQSICDAIRQTDASHLIGIGMMEPYLNTEDKYHAFPFVNDVNFAYTAPLGELAYYDAQAKEGSDASAHLTYPNAFWHDVNGISKKDQIIGSDIDLSYTDYQTRATRVFMMEEENAFVRIGAQVTPADQNGGGELRVWSLRFAECDASGKEQQVLFTMESSVDVPFMCRGTSGTEIEGSVYEDDGSAYLESISEPTFFYVKDLNIPVEKGKYYQLTITMKQRGMNKNFTCAPAVEIYSCDDYNLLDASFVKERCEVLYAEAKAVGVPLIFDGIGADPTAENKGGQQYLTDVLAAIKQCNSSYIAR